MLKPERPPDDMRMYVRPSRSSAEEICNAFLADPTARHKFLLVGARGGGKSTELRAVARGLEGLATLMTIDLDASGVSATAVSAFDLLYISGVALLARVADADERKALFAELARAYADDEHEKLGSVQDALGGLVSFASATEAVVKAADLASGGLVSTTLDVVNKGFRLLGGARDPEVIAETSPRGRTLQAACQAIARKVRAAETAPLCVLVDGLEKMNGQAGERFQQVFCYTRLLADAEWSFAIAAPPSTLTETNSAAAVGYRTVPVWGFGTGDRARLVDLIRLRFQSAGFDDVDQVVAGALLDRLADASGGLPRHAIQMTHHAVEAALLADAPRIEPAHVDDGIQRVGESLALGLTGEDFDVLAAVDRRGVLPGKDRAARLFADGRILAHAPAPGQRRPSFSVHPLLAADVRELDANAHASIVAREDEP